MLRSFARHLNETVFRGPDDEGGSAAPDDSVTNDVGGDEPADGGADDGGGEDPGRPLTVREQLKRSMDEVRAADEGKPAPEAKRDNKSGRYKKGAAPEGEAPAGTPPAAAPAQDDIPAPASLTPEAKNAWANAPKEIKEAFVKREADMQKGVEELKQRYSQIDQAISPHSDALRQMNATPAQAVDRMFLWFKALAGTPASSFPALAQSMGIDWNKLIAASQPQGGQQPGGQQVTQSGQPVPAEGAPALPPEVQEYIGRLEQQINALGQGFQQFDGRFQTMEQSVQAQNMARTTENLNIWSKNKEHFNEVRQEMAQLLQSGMIPLLPDGQVDLDKAYEHAIYLNPTVRAKVIAAQQDANLKAQQEASAAATTAATAQAEKAKKAAVSIPSRGTPGDGNGAPRNQARKPGQRTSVRDSLKAALSELRDQ